MDRIRKKTKYNWFVTFSFILSFFIKSKITKSNFPDLNLKIYDRADLEFPATVPGGIYSDLYKAKLVPENLFGFNDVQNRWVAYQNVDYVKHFSGLLNFEYF